MMTPNWSCKQKVNVTLKTQTTEDRRQKAAGKETELVWLTIPRQAQNKIATALPTLCIADNIRDRLLSTCISVDKYSTLLYSTRLGVACRDFSDRQTHATLNVLVDVVVDVSRVLEERSANSNSRPFVLMIHSINIFPPTICLDIVMEVLLLRRVTRGRRLFFLWNESRWSGGGCQWLWKVKDSHSSYLSSR